MMRKVFTITALSMLVTGCQSSGYTTGRDLTYPCEESPITSSDPRLKEASGGRCQLLNTSRSDVDVSSHLRPLSVNRISAAAIYTRALHGTYLQPVDPQYAIRNFERFKAPDTIVRWREAKQFGTYAEPLNIQLFERRESTTPCGVAVQQWELISVVYGFRNLMVTYVCTQDLTEEKLAAMARSLSVDRSKLRL